MAESDTAVTAFSEVTPHVHDNISSWKSAFHANLLYIAIYGN